MQIHSPLALKAHLLCAECLGLVGAVDPARLEYEPKSTDILLTTAGDLIIELISKHLVRLLRVADSLMTLEAAVYALQVSTPTSPPPSPTQTAHTPYLLTH